MDNVKNEALFFAITKYMNIFLQIILSAILSRILTPDDFGVVAIVMVFVVLFNTLSNTGLGTAVVQHKELSKEDLDSIFTFSVYISFFLSIIFIILSYPISLYFNREELKTICMLLSISIFFYSLNMVPNGILLKNKSFFRIGIRLLICTIFSGVVTIVLAINGFSFFSLVIQNILFSMLQFIVSFTGLNLRFRILIDINVLKKIRSYSMYQFLYNMMNYIAQNFDNLVVGKVIGSTGLAFYNKSYTLMRYPVNNLVHVITPILHPYLSEHQKSPKYIYQKYIQYVKFFSLVGTFISIVCFWASEELIIGYFGKQWYEAIPPFQMLSLCILPQMVNALAGSIYQSLGYTNIMFRSGIIHVSISIFAIVLGAMTKSIEYLALFVSISMFIKFHIETYFLIKVSLKESLIGFYKKFTSELMIVSTSILIVIILGNVTISNLFYSLVFKFTIIFAVWIVGLFITQDVKYIINMLPGKIKKKINVKD